MNDLTAAIALIGHGDFEGIRRAVAAYRASRSDGASEPTLTVGGQEWNGDRLAAALQLVADLKAELKAGATNEELREFASSYTFAMSDVFDVLRLLI